MSTHEERGLLSSQALRLSDVVKTNLGGDSDAWVAEVEARAILAFTSHVSTEYNRHNGAAIRDDMIIACARFGVNPAWYYTDDDGEVDEHSARMLRADVAHYRIMHELDEEDE